jgi:hypothetical protein
MRKVSLNADKALIDGRKNRHEETPSASFLQECDIPPLVRPNENLPATTCSPGVVGCAKETQSARN